MPNMFFVAKGCSKFVSTTGLQFIGEYVCSRFAIVAYYLKQFQAVPLNKRLECTLGASVPFIIANQSCTPGADHFVRIQPNLLRSVAVIRTVDRLNSRSHLTGGSADACRHPRTFTRRCLFYSIPSTLLYAIGAL